MRLEKVFTVNNQFQRSINIVSDFDDQSILDGYIITPLSEKVSSRILEGMVNHTNQSAWTVTGPYGAGKSACLLFLMQLIGQSNAKSIQEKTSLSTPELFQLVQKAIPGWPDVSSLIIPFVGSRESIALTILKGISKSLDKYAIQYFSNAKNNIHKLLDDFNNGKGVNEAELVSQVGNLVDDLEKKRTPYSNIVFIFDELGKSLQFASQNTGENDIGVLQQFAELANRSHGKLTLITVLHQAFDRYAETLNPIQQQEWSKIQGRFENISFLETNVEILNLLQRAIKRTDYRKQDKPYEDNLLKECYSLNLLPNELPKELGLQIFAGCLPLHPTTALLLSRLFRSFFAQNERSLFAFMSSQEPFGFQSFLKSNVWSKSKPLPLYRLNNLFDYMSSSFGGSLYTLSTGKKWAEINDALERIPSRSSRTDIDLIKCIGLLELFGDQQYTKSSKEVIAYSLGIDNEEVEISLARLLKTGIIVYREFKQAYGFWQGSDINLDDEYKAAFSKIDRSSRLSEYISNNNKINPYVARRHQFITGTLRYFEPVVIDYENLNQINNLSATNIGGGVLVIVLKNRFVSDEDLLKEVISSSKNLENQFNARILFQIPSNLQGLKDAYEEVLTWQFVRQNTPALEGDRIARRELSLHEHIANEKLTQLLIKYFDISIAYRSSQWVYRSKVLNFKSSRDLRTKLSDIFNLVYKDAPIVLNELVNRNKLSSAAAAGRNALLEKLINYNQLEDLGISGYPPEMSMYLSVIKQSGLHHLEEGEWIIDFDSSHDDMNIKPLWNGVFNFINENSEKPIGVPFLYEYLRKPPYGLKNGLLPIYLLIALLKWQSHIAIYEENSYVPKISIAMYERLVKVPERFKIQMFPTTDEYTEILHKYASLINPEIDPRAISIVSTVQPLMQLINRLPKYAFQTALLSNETKRLRDVIITAKNPQTLLLKTLPQAFGYSLTNKKKNETLIEEFFSKLSLSLFELEDCYEQLLKRIQKEISQSMYFSDDLSECRKEIPDRFQLLGNWIDDLNLKSFLLRLVDSTLSNQQWLESIGAVVSNIPPKNWNDQDEISFKIKTRIYAAKLRNIEDIIFEEAKSTTHYNLKHEHIRIGISNIQGDEIKRIIRVNNEEKISGEKMKLLIEEIIKNQPGNIEVKAYALSKMLENLINDEIINRANHE